MKARLLIYAAGAAVLAVLCYFFDIGTVANYIQVISALPWFYTMYRVEELHRKHEEMKRSGHR